MQPGADHKIGPARPVTDLGHQPSCLDGKLARYISGLAATQKLGADGLAFGPALLTGIRHDMQPKQLAAFALGYGDGHVQRLPAVLTPIDRHQNIGEELLAVMDRFPRAAPIAGGRPIFELAGRQAVPDPLLHPINHSL